MKKFHLTQNELCEYGLACEMRRLVVNAKIMLDTDAFPEDLWDINDELFEVLEKATLIYDKYIRNVDKVQVLAELKYSDNYPF